MFFSSSKGVAVIKIGKIQRVLPADDGLTRNQVETDRGKAKEVKRGVIVLQHDGAGVVVS